MDDKVILYLQIQEKNYGSNDEDIKDRPGRSVRYIEGGLYMHDR